MAANGTPWFKLFSQIAHHPKLEDLCLELNEPLPHVLGYLVCLWCWVNDFAPDGDLAEYSNKQIARAAKWTGDPDDLYNALVASGWIDQGPNFRKIHNWESYAESYKRAQQRRRDRISPRVNTVSPRGTSCVSERRGEERRREERKAEKDTKKPTEKFTQKEKEIIKKLQAAYVDHFPRRTEQTKQLAWMISAKERMRNGGHGEEYMLSALRGVMADRWANDTGNATLGYVFKNSTNLDKYAAIHGSKKGAGKSNAAKFKETKEYKALQEILAPYPIGLHWAQVKEIVETGINTKSFTKALDFVTAKGQKECSFQQLMGVLKNVKAATARCK